MKTETKNRTQKYTRFSKAFAARKLVAYSDRAIRFGGEKITIETGREKITTTEGEYAALITDHIATVLGIQNEYKKEIGRQDLELKPIFKAINDEAKTRRWLSER